MPGDEQSVGGDTAAAASALADLAGEIRDQEREESPTCIDIVANDTTAISNTTTTNTLNNAIHPSREQALLDGLKQLDDEYQEMWEQQRVLFDALESLEKDEQRMTQALTKIEEPPKPIPRPMNKDAKVMQRLQDALLAAGSSDDDDDDSDSDDSDDDI